MKHWYLPILFILIFLLPCTVATAIQTGPAVGGKIPEFRLPDHTGKQQDLHTIAGPKGAVIVFIRSADW